MTSLDTRATRAARAPVLLALLLPLLGPLGAAASAASLRVVATEPAARMVTAAAGTAITVDFDRAVDPTSVTPTSFWAFGRWSGAVSGTYTFANGGERVTLSPDQPLSAGEQVMVVLSHDLLATDGSSMRPAGYSFQFWTRALPAPMSFEEVETFSTRTTPEETSRAYGGFGSDVNGDGFLDITIVNEDTDDLRVFLNSADGSGLFDDFLQPTYGTGCVPSPSEPSDFNRDGHVDIAVANTQCASVSILLGNGDGTFGPQQEIAVGVGVRGIAVLDVDGDGDTDVVNTNNTTGNLSLLLNDGSGVFGTPIFFDTGQPSEWALAAADMNEDGILDLVVGTRGSSQRAVVMAGNGNGTFSFNSMSPAFGSVWMLACGDVNGDGHEDVVTANSSNNTGTVLLGSGEGTLVVTDSEPADSFPLATDLGDLDGDGDLDWATSAFNGDWRIYENDGTGTFAFDQEFNAPSAASCTIPLDIDNDGDLDLALIDELADVVIVMRNIGTPPPLCPADLDESGAVAFNDLLALLAAWGPCPACPEDLDGDGVVAFADLLALLAAWGPC